MGYIINSDKNHPLVPIDSLNGGLVTVADINIVDTDELMYGYRITGIDTQVAHDAATCSKKTYFPNDYVGRYYSAMVPISRLYVYSEDGTLINSTREVYHGIKSFEIDSENHLIFYSSDNDVIELTQELSGIPASFRCWWSRGETDPDFTITKGYKAATYMPYSYKDVNINEPYRETLINHIFEGSSDFSSLIEQITKPLYGKVLVMFGDSEMQYLNDYSDNIQMYKDILGISAYRNYAIAGKAWETTEETETDPTTATQGIHAQFNKLLSDISDGKVRKEDIGAIVWMMGTNLYVQGNFWETENSVLNTDIRTMCGAAHTFMKRVLLEFTDPDVRLLGVIPIQGENRNEFFSSGYMERHNLIRDIHRCWSIPFLDLQYEGEVPAKTVLSCDNGTLGDNVHWSKLGMQMGIRKICGKLITI